MPSNREPTAAEKAVREVLSEWETFTASDGNTSVRMREARSEAETVRAVLEAVRPHRFDGILGWTIAEHSDGSGEPALYHECSPHSALERLDVVDLVQVLIFIDRHACGRPDRAIWEPSADQSGEGQTNA